MRRLRKSLRRREVEGWGTWKDEWKEKNKKDEWKGRGWKGLDVRVERVVTHGWRCAWCYKTTQGTFKTLV